jgi:hypothetical protein
MRAAGTRRSDQSAVWSDIVAKTSRKNADSPTQSMAAVYDKHIAGRYAADAGRNTVLIARPR